MWGGQVWQPAEPLKGGLEAELNFKPNRPLHPPPPENNSAELHQSQKHPLAKVGGRVHLSPPRGDAPAGGRHRQKLGGPL